MGCGAYMRIVNNSSIAVTTAVTSPHCLYDHGTEGSNPGFFNGLTIPAFTTRPAEGPGQYIKAKTTGACFFASSTFTLVIDGLNILADSLRFTDSNKKWSCAGQPYNIDVAISNVRQQAEIVITLSDHSIQ